MVQLHKRSAAFTGHRDVPPAHFDLIIKAIYEISGQIDEFIVGGALGADTIALEAVVTLAEMGDIHPRPVIVVPDTVDTQPRQARIMIDKAKAIGAEIVELRRGHTAEAFKYRNQVMVDRAKAMDNGSFLTAYWDGRYKSGTYSAINYAGRVKLPVKYIMTDFECSPSNQP